VRTCWKTPASRRWPPVLLGGAVLVARAARACPDCPSAREVRRAVFEGGFWEPLVMVGLPFVLVGFLGALLYRVGLPSGRHASTAADEVSGPRG
jgi:hypothetical protein